MDRVRFATRAKQGRRLLGAAIGRPLAGPHVVSLEITHNCNLRCSFCESHGSRQALPITARREYAGGRRTMDLATIRSLAADLKSLGADMVELSGKGDAITHPQLLEIVKTIKGAGIRCALVTNGTIPREGLASGLVAAGLDRLNLSLNAGSREGFARVAGKDLFDKARQFLEDVLRARGGTGHERAPWVRISHVLYKDNLDDLENMVRVCCDLRVDELAWYVMGELPETTDLQLEPRDVEKILAQLPALGRMADEARIVHDTTKFARELQLRVKHEAGAVQENPLQRSLPCYEGWMFCVIQPDGAVLPCCYCEETVLGNIFDQGFRAVWQGERYRDFRRRSLEMPSTGAPICGECFTTCNRAEENRRVHDRVVKIQKLVPIAAPGRSRPVPQPAALPRTQG